MEVEVPNGAAASAKPDLTHPGTVSAGPGVAASLRPVLDWLVHAGNARSADGTSLFGELCERLVGAGVPLWRAAAQLENLHPVYYGYCLHWYAGEPAYEVARSHEFAESEAFASSPYMASLSSGGAYRVRLEGVDRELDVPLLKELQARGATDFIADIVPTGASLPPGVSWTTRRRGGFRPEDVAALKTLTPYIGMVFGALAEQRKTAAVLRTYLGTETGREVFEGRTRRGDIRKIDAVILLTDLRGFTSKTGAYSDPELLGALNDYFECVADAVGLHGGEVLKFIGDGVLSVFRVSDPADTPTRCRAAVGAVRHARAALDARNRTRDANGQEPLDFVAALELGPLSYGNIGARERLDFTVVGTPANVASRIESLAKELHESTLMTAAVANHIPDGERRSLGRRALRGVVEPVEIFALDEARPDQDPDR